MKRVMVLATLAVCGFGQAQFEVATVKPVDKTKLGNSININLGTVRHEEITFGNVTLNECIRFAYDMASEEQITGLDWIKSRDYMYDIDAKGTPGSSREQLQAMLRTLLQERFKMVVHRDKKEMSHYALVVAKGGPKIKSVPAIPEGMQRITYGGRFNTVLTMPGLAYLLSRFETERPIIDLTGLNGLYEVKLEWAWAPKTGKADAELTPGPSLFTAVEEQLGLKLEGRKGPVEILVVDSAEKVPAEN
jgi:uncharacterized protein (TIGR03435 family)